MSAHVYILIYREHQIWTVSLITSPHIYFVVGEVGFINLYCKIITHAQSLPTLYFFIVTCVGGSKEPHIAYPPYCSKCSVWPILNVQYNILNARQRRRRKTVAQRGPW